MSTDDPMPNGAREWVERGIYTRGGKYHVLFTEGGRVTFKTTDANGWPLKTLTAARAERGAMLAAKQRGESVMPTRLKFEEAIAEFMAQARLHPRTRKMYQAQLARPEVKRLYSRKVSAIRVDDIAKLVRALEAQGLKGSSIRTVLVPLSSLFEVAVRRGWTPTNPVRALLRSERPQVRKRAHRILTSEEIASSIAAAGDWAPLITLTIFTGLRLSEVLALTWNDVDLSAGVLRVRRQLERGSLEFAQLKTNDSQRDIPLPPAIVSVLRRHQIASRWSQPEHPVFVSPDATRPTPIHHRNVQRAWGSIRIAAKLRHPLPRFHDLRHTAASVLIADSGGDVSYVSRILGHASKSMTLDTYADLFDAVSKADEVRTRMEQRALAALGTPGA